MGISKEKKEDIVPKKKRRKTRGYWSEGALRIGKEVWEREREEGHGR